jgi:hypothetical protein
MHLIYPDVARNRLHLIFVGVVDKASGRAVLRDVKAALKILPRGFDLLTDLRDMKSLSRDSEAYIKSIMALFGAHGIKRIARILHEPTDDFGFKLMSYFHYGPKVPIVICSNLEEALKQLVEE